MSDSLERIIDEDTGNPRLDLGEITFDINLYYERKLAILYAAALVNIARIASDLLEAYVSALEAQWAYGNEFGAQENVFSQYVSEIKKQLEIFSISSEDLNLSHMDIQTQLRDKILAHLKRTLRTEDERDIKGTEEKRNKEGMRSKSVIERIVEIIGEQRQDSTQTERLIAGYHDNFQRGEITSKMWPFSGRAYIHETPVRDFHTGIRHISIKNRKAHGPPYHTNAYDAVLDTMRDVHEAVLFIRKRAFNFFTNICNEEKLPADYGFISLIQSLDQTSAIRNPRVSGAIRNFALLIKELSEKWDPNNQNYGIPINLRDTIIRIPVQELYNTIINPNNASQENLQALYRIGLRYKGYLFSLPE